MFYVNYKSHICKMWMQINMMMEQDDNHTIVLIKELKDTNSIRKYKIMNT